MYLVSYDYPSEAISTLAWLWFIPEVHNILAGLLLQTYTINLIYFFESLYDIKSWDITLVMELKNGNGN